MLPLTHFGRHLQMRCIAGELHRTVQDSGQSGGLSSGTNFTASGSGSHGQRVGPLGMEIQLAFGLTTGK